jgi:Ca2+-binding RTX toxin-like protein
VEKLVLTGESAVNGTGNDASNALTGNKAANRLEGGAGNDTLTGAAGADTLAGGAGDDTYVVTPGDVLIESATGGTDTVRSQGDWTLAEGVENLVLLGTRNSNATGNTAANTLTGNSAANVLAGGNGDDVLNGGGGDDVLRGGAGGDRLTGGAGADVFAFDVALSASTNTDRVLDFTPGSDRIRLDNDVFTALGVGPLAATQFVAGAALQAGQDADDRIVYNTSTGALYYDADGSGAAKAVQFAILGATTHPALGAADILVVD